MKILNFITERYKSEADYMRNKEQTRKIRFWINKGTIDSWRHKMMYTCINPILNSYKKSTWLTIGDGRYGLDANYILNQGCNAIASNINTDFLKKASKSSFINKYLKINAEHIALRDNSYDFILCKESLHHLPRPYIGIYEMLRVAKKGIVLIEPNDIFNNHSLSQKIFWCTKITIKKILRIKNNIEYEKIGNYIFRVSIEEIEKISIA